MNNLELGATKTCQMTHLRKMKMKETSCREGVGMLLTKSHIYSLFTVVNGKSVHFPFRKVWRWVLCTFLQLFGRNNFLLIITLHSQKLLGKMGAKAKIKHDLGGLVGISCKKYILQSVCATNTIILQGNINKLLVEKN